MKKIAFLLALIGIVFSSCNGKYTIAKRKYNKGFYVNFSGSKATKPNSAFAIKKQNTVTPEKMQEEVILVSKQSLFHNANTTVRSQNQESTKPNASSLTRSFSTDKKLVAELSNKSQEVKTFKKLETKSISVKKESDSSTVKLVICVILAFFIAPLAMYIWDQKTDMWFWIDLIAYLLLFTYFFLGGLGGLFGLAALVIALLRIFNVI